MRAPVTPLGRPAIPATPRSYSMAIVLRLLRFFVVVPLAALALHCLQPAIPWWSWCGISALSQLFLWFVDGGLALARWKKRRIARTARLPATGR